MILTTLESIPGQSIDKHIGIVQGSSIRTKHAGQDFMAGLKNIMGGELKAYTQLLNESRKQATTRLKKDAKKQGANAVLNVRYSTADVAQGAIEVMCYGTAVVLSES